MAGSDEKFQDSMRKGHSAAWDQQWAQAAICYQSALEEFPDHPKALTSLGLALFEQQRYDESLLIYQHATRIAPNDPLPLEKVGQLSERLGNIKEAIQAYFKAAELYIKNQEPDKALANWVRVTQLDSDHVTAHSYLAMVYERLGHAEQAASQYLMLASLLQRSGNIKKASEMVGQALHLIPNSQEVRRAQAMLNNGQLLPKPIRPQGGTGPLRMARVKQLESPQEAETNLDPIAEARKLALTHLAEILFDLSEAASHFQTPKQGMQAIVQGTGELNLKQSTRSKIALHLGQAIDSQTKNQEIQATEELEKALAAGFIDPALYFDLGFLRSKTERLESALRHLQTAVKHPDFALGSRLLMAQIQHRLGRLPESATEYMEALKVADAMVVLPEQSEELRQLYEPLIEALNNQTDTAVMEQFCENVKQMLLRPNWRAEILLAREQLPKAKEGMPLLPLAEILVQAQSSQVIEAISKVRTLAKAGHLRTAMDEAFEALKYAPTYLPLHTLIGDLLIQDGRIQDAITKYSIVAETYSARGEAAQAVNLLQRIVQVAPMDLAVRNRLIDQLAARGMVDEAINEYFGLADIYYRLAELDKARKTYATALHLAQQGGTHQAWSVKLMHRMADIDMQRLDWRQALRIFEQIRTLEPDDLAVRKSLIGLNVRLNQAPQAAAELDGFLDYMQISRRGEEIIDFLTDLVEEYPKEILLRRALADQYRKARRIPEAIKQLDSVGDLLLQADDREGAIQTLEMILAMNPNNADDYKNLLTRLKSEIQG